MSGVMWPAEWSDADIKRYANEPDEAMRASLLVHFRFVCQRARDLEAELARANCPDCFGQQQPCESHTAATPPGAREAAS